MSDVEKFLEEKDKTWGVDAGCMIKFDEIKRLLRLCKKYWEALEEIRQEECWESTNCMSGVRACDPCIAREALAYTGTEEK